MVCVHGKLYRIEIYHIAMYRVKSPGCGVTGAMSVEGRGLVRNKPLRGFGGVRGAAPTPRLVGTGLPRYDGEGVRVGS